LRRFRYRTPALTGPWRDNAFEAANDAVRAKQAVNDITQSAGIKWTVPGQIEERATDDASSRLRS
jgi:hypothetical protein